MKGAENGSRTAGRAGTIRPENSRPKKQVNPLTRKQAVSLLEGFRQHRPRYSAFIATLLLAGLRTGEACGPQWSGIDCEAAEIRVNRTLDVRRVKLKGWTKNGKRRIVEVSDSLAKILRARSADSKRETLAAGRPVSPYLSTAEKGGAININVFRRKSWAKVLKEAKIEHHRFHDLCHNFATLAIQQDIGNAEWGSKQPGHPTVDYTLRQYHHFLPRPESRAIGNQLADIVGV